MGDYRIMGKILKYFSNKSHPSVSMKNFAQNIFATVRGELIFNPQHCSQERISPVKFSPPQVSGKIGEMHVFPWLKIMLCGTSIVAITIKNPAFF